jgi:hypothetical protein
MNPCGGDLSLSEALADPTVRALMAADGVDPRQLAAELRAVAARLNPHRKSEIRNRKTEITGGLLLPF